MSKQKVSRKQLLKEPDEFITFSGKMIRFFTERRKELSISLAVFLAVLLMIATYRYLDDRWENAASLQAEAVIEKYQRQIADGKTPELALAAVESEVKQVVDRYGGQVGGLLSRVFYADACLAAGRADEAIDLYRDAIRDVEPASYHYVRIQSGLAQAHLATKSYAQAAAVLQSIADSGVGGFADGALFQLALIYAITGESEKSADAYRSLVERYPESAYAPMAREAVGGI
jgi:hypothetical protein